MDPFDWAKGLPEHTCDFTDTSDWVTKCSVCGLIDTRQCSDELLWYAAVGLIKTSIETQEHIKQRIRDAQAVK